MDGDNLKCSFCDKRRDQVEVLIAGPGGAAIALSAWTSARRSSRTREPGTKLARDPGQGAPGMS